MPEELNRVLTDHASDLLLCSTEVAMTNLEREGVIGEAHLVGDVMADVSLAFRGPAQERSAVLERHGLEPSGYVLATAHRAGTVDDPGNLRLLVELLENLPLPCVLPLHPRTAARLDAAGLRERLDRPAAGVLVLPPLGYLDFTKLAMHARAILTDSGGVQKEAYLLGVPCVTLRERTEWTETVDAGWNTLVGLDREAALAALSAPPPPGERPELYGGGRAAAADRRGPRRLHSSAMMRARGHREGRHRGPGIRGPAAGDRVRRGGHTTSSASTRTGAAWPPSAAARATWRT